ncbi:hypothetical protein GE21DRAFT_8096 [Neurospora crassa]|uniref:Rhodopsin domain-containing protein n=2 Tax=Neurospora crassa TaxID=5141 RepID=V5INC6_NEUCR|nr:uncharacterized protein NCU04106 [Neurospora crassa OR74A]XP_011394615.1 hypothetical protein NCU04106 [Neurospora crassa OR74A]KHE87416.1 hypothetical protein GE21DRAFT_8096 [Neurospora crassa]ESA42648.1 hypothetical protein NCU04106 [Neurospora crassa OR74A]ESA42649.1 hypothetical protein, variant [Neurospora crassa OR74A]CAD36967.1 related to integral membrane protein PTH11 [Neurospora crassa]|eukprot:XP_011394614.1 uncharacterized protein NCU04106 [Neurospora crassa OR74A]
MAWTYNTTDPDAPTIGHQITGVAIALTVLSFVTVCLRTYVRAFILKAIGFDDWVIIITWVAAAGFAVVTIVQTRWGLGLVDMEDFPSQNMYNFNILQYIGAPFYISSIFGFKLALLTSYLRFIPKGGYRYLTLGVIVSCFLFHLSFLLVQLNLCQPAAKQWDYSIPGKCLKGVPFYTSMASLTIIFDVTAMLLPFPVLLKSQIQTRKKVVLLGMFGLGLFITIIQIIRIQTVKRLVNPIDSAPLIMWSTVENNLGIIVTNVPTLAPLIKYFNERSRAGNTGSRTRGTGYPKEVGSRYALQTWRTGKSKGCEKLDSINDMDLGSIEGNTSKDANNSTEFILDGGITKRTDVVISRE